MINQVDMKHIKHIIIAITLLAFFATEAYSQEFGILTGYTTKNQLLLDVHFGMKSGLGFKINAGINLKPGTEGTNKIDIIDWDEFPTNVIKEGSYYNTFDLGIGYYKDFFIGALIGIADENKYKNCFDPYRYLGNYGEYCLVKDAANKFNYGLEAGYSWKFYSMGLYWTKYVGAGLKVCFSIRKE